MNDWCKMLFFAKAKLLLVSMYVLPFNILILSTSLTNNIDITDPKHVKNRTLQEYTPSPLQLIWKYISNFQRSHLTWDPVKSLIMKILKWSRSPWTMIKWFSQMIHHQDQSLEIHIMTPRIHLLMPSSRQFQTQVSSTWWGSESVEKINCFFSGCTCIYPNIYWFCYEDREYNSTHRCHNCYGPEWSCFRLDI